jgi:hypothetical protein
MNQVDFGMFFGFFNHNKVKAVDDMIIENSDLNCKSSTA